MFSIGQEHPRACVTLPQENSLIWEPPLQLSTFMSFRIGGHYFSPFPWNGWTISSSIQSLSHEEFIDKISPLLTSSSSKMGGHPSFASLQPSSSSQEVS